MTWMTNNNYLKYTIEMFEYDLQAAMLLKPRSSIESKSNRARSKRKTMKTTTMVMRQSLTELTTSNNETLRRKVLNLQRVYVARQILIILFEVSKYVSAYYI